MQGKSRISVLLKNMYLLVKPYIIILRIGNKLNNLLTSFQLHVTEKQTGSGGMLSKQCYLSYIIVFHYLLKSM